MKLRRNEYCPVHRSHFCCGREAVREEKRLIRLGVQRIEDPHHPRGYRELRSAAEMRKLMNRKIVEQDRKCGICQIEFTDYNDVVPYADIGIRHNVTVVRQDAPAMSFPDATFDGAVSFTMLHHVPSEAVQNRLLAEVARVLRPGGILRAQTASTAVHFVCFTSSTQWIHLHFQSASGQRFW